MFVNTEKKYIWKNSSFHKWDDSNIHILSHTLHYGTGVFEGVRAYMTNKGPAIFRLHDHTKRLFGAASKISLKIPFSENELNKAQSDNLNEDIKKWPEAKKNGISVIKSSHKQYENPLHSGNKIIGTYFSNTMALHEALDNGADEAIMLDKNGYISEGSGENVFIVKNQSIFTPTPENCLNGITRQSVIQIAKDLKMQIYEKNIDYDDLLNADEAFFTGTAVEITPITIVDNKPVSNGKRGNITKELQDKFQQIISGEDSSYESWLTYTN